MMMTLDILHDHLASAICTPSYLLMYGDGVEGIANASSSLFAGIGRM